MTRKSVLYSENKGLNPLGSSKFYQFTKAMEMRNVMSVFIGNTVREVINFANDNSIHKEDIVSIMKDKDQIYLIYYRHIPI